MTFDGLEMRSAFAGANDRADLFLVANKSCFEKRWMACRLYHTTNAVPNTFSKNFVAPESRLLATGSKPFLALLDMALKQFERRMRLSRGFHALQPRPSTFVPMGVDHASESEPDEYDADMPDYGTED